MRSNGSATRERASLTLKAATLGALVFLYFPLVVITLYAFTTETSTYQFPPPGLTTNWFGETFSRADFWQALGMSLRVAGTATLIAIVLGTFAAGALYRSRFFGKDFISLLILLPIALPGIVTGIALRIGIRTLDLDFSFWTVV